MKPYDAEVLVLGTVLRHGVSAVQKLTADKFIFDGDGNFGTEHAEIWQKIVDITVSGRQPTLVNVLDVLPAYSHVLRSLIDRLSAVYHVYDHNPEAFEHWTSLVNKNGSVYQMAQAGQTLGASIRDVETFMQTASKIEDVDQWATEQLEKFSQMRNGVPVGYVHISEVVNMVQDRWKRILEGYEQPLLDSGMPSLSQNKLFPRGKMAVIHGLSGSGKSSFVFQVNLGTAFGLKRFGLPGCVAINSLEMDQDDLVERMTSILSRVDVSRFITNTVSKKDVDNLWYWSEIVKQLPIFIDNTNFITTSAMQYRATGLHVSSFGPVVQLSSDYGELFADDDASEEQRMNHVFRQQFHLSRLINASVLAISQSTHNSADTGRTYIAGADGTRYSRGILQSTDILVELWNAPQILLSGRKMIAPEDCTPAHPWLFIQKYRGAAVGIKIPLGWRAENTMFFDLAFNQTEGNETLFTHLDYLHEMFPEEVGSW